MTVALNGFLAQSLPILWKIFLQVDLDSRQAVKTLQFNFNGVLFMALPLHLILVTLEKLTTIKLRMHYSNVTNDNKRK